MGTLFASLNLWAVLLNKQKCCQWFEAWWRSCDGLCAVFIIFMMTSSNGNIFRVTSPLCREFTGPGEFPTQRPVTRSFGVFFDLRLNKRLSKQPWGWRFETPSWSLWRQCNVVIPFFTCNPNINTRHGFTWKLYQQRSIKLWYKYPSRISYCSITIVSNIMWLFL